MSRVRLGGSHPVMIVMVRPSGLRLNPTTRPRTGTGQPNSRARPEPSKMPGAANPCLQQAPRLGGHTIQTTTTCRPGGQHACLTPTILRLGGGNRSSSAGRSLAPSTRDVAGHRPHPQHHPTGQSRPLRRAAHRRVARAHRRPRPDRDRHGLRHRLHRRAQSKPPRAERRESPSQRAAPPPRSRSS